MIVTKSQVEIALRLLAEQKDINYIIQATSLTESEITKLKLFGTINNKCTL